MQIVSPLPEAGKSALVITSDTRALCKDCVIIAESIRITYCIYGIYAKEFSTVCMVSSEV